MILSRYLTGEKPILNWRETCLETGGMRYWNWGETDTEVEGIRL